MSVIKPILFNTEMVRAILDGRKTVTRRVIGEDQRGTWDAVNDVRENNAWATIPCYLLRELSVDDKSRNIMYPKYDVGDILYVRETWAMASDLFGEFPEPIYKANFFEQDLQEAKKKHFKWHPSIHMPKEAARIFLRVADVRVERLQDITEDDMISEGTRDGGKYLEKSLDDPYPEWDERYRGWIGWNRACFEALWNSTLKEKRTGPLSPYRFCFNPWVWVYVFERVGKPE